MYCILILFVYHTPFQDRSSCEIDYAKFIAIENDRFTYLFIFIWWIPFFQNTVNSELSFGLVIWFSTLIFPFLKILFMNEEFVLL